MTLSPFIFQPPTTPEMVGARMLLQERLDRGVSFTIIDRFQVFLSLSRSDVPTQLFDNDSDGRITFGNGYEFSTSFTTGGHSFDGEYPRSRYGRG